MHWSLFFPLVSIPLLLPSPPRQKGDEGYAKLSPFEAIRWEEAQPDVQIAGTWYRLRAIEGLPVDQIVAFCGETYSDRWKKRFEEDLVEVLSRMGSPPPPQVDLLVESPETGRTTTLRQVEMTQDNRLALWRAAKNRSRSEERPAGDVVRRVSREHATSPPAGFAELASGPTAAGRGATISRPWAEEDLDQLEWLIVNRYAYRDLRRVDFRAALDAIRAALGEGIPRGAFALRIAKFLALFGDGHTRLAEDLDESLEPGYAPFLAGTCGDRLVAFRPDRSGFLEAGMPFLKSIDGLDVARWLAAAAPLVPAGSEAFVRQATARMLRHLGHLRAELGLPSRPKVEVEVESADGSKHRRLNLPIVPTKPVFGDWPRGDSRLLEGNVGYLRISRMDDDPSFVDSLLVALDRFRDVRGLVIDVRENGGGSRVLIPRLFARFMGPEDPPRIGNVAAYRLGPGEDPARPEGYLADRFLFPASSPHWSPAERGAVEAFGRSFRPRWSPPTGEFSVWHHFVVQPPGSGSPFPAPVVVLMDEGCFSATDILLGTFKGWRNVTLLGTPSGGGSGRARPATLARSGIRIQLSSMASFRPDGTLYDGEGVEPDVLVEREPGDFVGAGDAQLAAALARLAR